MDLLCAWLCSAAETEAELISVTELESGAVHAHQVVLLCAGVKLLLLGFEIKKLFSQCRVIQTYWAPKTHNAAGYKSFSA